MNAFLVLEKKIFLRISNFYQFTVPNERRKSRSFFFKKIIVVKRILEQFSIGKFFFFFFFNVIDTCLYNRTEKRIASVRWDYFFFSHVINR